MIFQKIKRFMGVDIFKTIYLNYKYLPFKQAFKLPCLVSYHTSLSVVKGEIIINCKPKFGILCFGFNGVGTIDSKFTRSIWEVRGKLFINGRTNFGRGSKISIKENARLAIGANFSISGNSSIICCKDIAFGNDCLLSWDILIMDSDFHSILDRNKRRLNPTSPINIGNHVWIGCRSTILKGVSIPNDCIIAASSVLTKSFNAESIIIGGSGLQQRVLKENITWCKEEL